jgi:hypothetical protein
MKQKTKPKTVISNLDLRNDMLSVYNEMRAKNLSVQEGQSLAAVAKVVIMSAREERLYHRSKTKQMPFFEEGSKK